MKKNTQGFTLIELLVVIAIIAILSVVVILTLNPAELLKQARDSNRVSDMSTLKTAISEYLSDVITPSLGNVANCSESAATTTISANCAFTGTYTVVASSSRAVDGTGWVPVAFTGISSGAPIGNLPADPVNTNLNVYRYAASSTLTFEIDALLESAKQNLSTGAAQTDGGSSTTLYEVGTAPGLNL